MSPTLAVKCRMSELIVVQLAYKLNCEKKIKINRCKNFHFHFIQDVFPDKATERKILLFTIKCRNEGCEWTGELREKEVQYLFFFTDREIFTLIQRSNHAHCAEGLKHYSLYEAKEVLKLKIDSGHEC